MELELSNYWDDFKERVNETIDCLQKGELPGLERLTVHLTEQCNFRCDYCNMRFSKRTMEKELAKKIINTENVDKLKTSFDTPYAAEFDSVMGVKAFGKVVENMKSYSKEMEEKMLSITAVLNRKTYRHMLNLAEFVQENFKVYNLYYSNYKGSNPEFAFTDEEIDDMFENYIPKVLNFFKETGNEYSYKQLSLYSQDDFRNVSCRFPSNKEVPCYIQLSEMTIDVDGNCFDCSHLYRDGVRPDEVINVKEDTLENCFKKRKERYKDISKMIYLSDKCLNGCNKNLIGFNHAVSHGEYI